MSAYTYAHSGEEAMHKRYLEAIPEIDGAIAEAKKLASPQPQPGSTMKPASPMMSL